MRIKLTGLVFLVHNGRQYMSYCAVAIGWLEKCRKSGEEKCRKE